MINCVIYVHLQYVYMCIFFAEGLFLMSQAWNWPFGKYLLL